MKLIRRKEEQPIKSSTTDIYGKQQYDKSPGMNQANSGVTLQKWRESVLADSPGVTAVQQVLQRARIGTSHGELCFAIGNE